MIALFSRHRLPRHRGENRRPHVQAQGVGPSSFHGGRNDWCLVGEGGVPASPSALRRPQGSPALCALTNGPRPIVARDVRCWSMNGLQAGEGLLADSDPIRTLSFRSITRNAPQDHRGIMQVHAPLSITIAYRFAVKNKSISHRSGSVSLRGSFLTSPIEQAVCPSCSIF